MPYTIGFHKFGLPNLWTPADIDTGAVSLTRWYVGTINNTSSTNLASPYATVNTFNDLAGGANLTGTPAQMALYTGGGNPFPGIYNEGYFANDTATHVPGVEFTPGTYGPLFASGTTFTNFTSATYSEVWAVIDLIATSGRVIPYALTHSGFTNSFYAPWSFNITNGTVAPYLYSDANTVQSGFTPRSYGASGTNLLCSFFRTDTQIAHNVDSITSEGGTRNLGQAYSYNFTSDIPDREGFGFTSSYFSLGAFRLKELIVIEGGYLNSTESNKVEGYLAWRWGIPRASGHPYQNNPPLKA